MRHIDNIIQHPTRHICAREPIQRRRIQIGNVPGDDGGGENAEVLEAVWLCGFGAEEFVFGLEVGVLVVWCSDALWERQEGSFWAWNWQWSSPFDLEFGRSSPSRTMTWASRCWIFFQWGRWSTCEVGRRASMPLGSLGRSVSYSVLQLQWCRPCWTYGVDGVVACHIHGDWEILMFLVKVKEKCFEMW